jgi:hypothetical protein
MADTVIRFCIAICLSGLFPVAKTAGCFTVGNDNAQNVFNRPGSKSGYIKKDAPQAHATELVFKTLPRRQSVSGNDGRFGNKPVGKCLFDFGYCTHLVDNYKGRWYFNVFVFDSGGIGRADGQSFAAVGDALGLVQPQILDDVRKADRLLHGHGVGVGLVAAAPKARIGVSVPAIDHGYPVCRCLLIVEQQVLVVADKV